MSSLPCILVLGIGNILWADEGFGVRCAEALAEHYVMPDHVTVMDGGTQGLYLLPYVEEAKRLLVFDAVDYGDPPSTLRIVVGDEVPRFMGAKKMKACIRPVSRKCWPPPSCWGACRTSWC